MSAWTDLEKAAVGDVVLITESGWGSAHPERRVIAKALKNKVVLDDGSSWKRNGNKWGADAWSRSYCRPFDQALFDELSTKHQRARLKGLVCRFFSGQDCAALSDEQWQRVWSICNEAKTESAAISRATGSNT